MRISSQQGTGGGAKRCGSGVWHVALRSTHIIDEGNPEEVLLRMTFMTLRIAYLPLHLTALTCLVIIFL